uniref:Uncharacterized protein n=1 Tax=Lepeophtheirus salmonis TaxID=72036 RepID=A0A0K2TJV8_LEPSM
MLCSPKYREKRSTLSVRVYNHLPIVFQSQKRLCSNNENRRELEESRL